MTDHPWDARPRSDNCVTIFGGGIAGLSAAHELCERGFQVQVWEQAMDPRYPRRGCDVGGMARTQWSRVHWPDVRSLDTFQPLAPEEAEQLSVAGKQAQPILHLPQRVVIERARDQALKLSRVLEVNQGEAGDDLTLKEEDIPDFAGNASGVDVSVRGWESFSNEERHDFATRAAAALSRHLSNEKAPPSPFFDRKARVWVVNLPRAEGKTLLTLIFTGEFPSSLPSAEFDRPDDVVARRSEAAPLRQAVDPHGNRDIRRSRIPRRVPADAFALVRLWSQRDASYATESDVRALYSEWEVDDTRLRGIGAYGSTDLHVIFAEMVDTLEKNPDIRHLYIEVSDRDFAKLSSLERLDRARKVAAVVGPFLPKKHGDEVILGGLVDVPNAHEPHRIRSSLRIGDKPSVVLEIVPLAEFAEAVQDSIQVLLSFRIRERWLPGEHGYRFFPAFYRHLYDTMRRTPILDATDKTLFSQEQERTVSITNPEKSRYVETSRTAYDNIRPTTSHVLAFSGEQGPTVLSRAKPKSLEEIREYFRILFGTTAEGGLGTDPREATRFSLKFLQYLTSGTTRRRRLETSSWWDFVQGDTYSKSVRTLIEKWPEALVAMDARRADARTHGNAMVQLVLDNLGPQGYRDGTLRGPTSEAWLSHWRRYLEAQGVEFIHGRLDGFQSVADRQSGQRRPWPTVSCFEPRYARIDDEDGVPLMPGYFVLATSAPEAARLAEEFRAVAADCGELLPDSQSDMAHAARLDLGNVRDAEPKGDLRHFAGIQFYFAEDVVGVDGHVYYPDSPWGLTSISQTRFWEDRTDWEHGYRGVLSAIVGIWNAPGKFTHKDAWHCSPTELAHEVWLQIRESLRSREHGPRPTRPSSVAALTSLDGIPEPLYYHLDAGLTWDEDQGHYQNASPFHIASPSGWRGRPGDPKRGYQVEHAWVVCGMFTKTFTRAPCMESANESGRHAVNAILEHLDRHAKPEDRFRGTCCQVYDPEDHEVADLRWFKDLDEKLAERGLPHFMEILQVDRRIDSVLRGGPDDPLDPLNVIRQLSRANRGLKSLFYSFFKPNC